MKVALVYDRVNKWGGAERVMLTLHEMFPDAPLYTSVHNPETAKWAKVFPEIHTSFLQNIPFVKTHHEWVPFLMPLAFEQFSFDEYDLVISVTSEFAKNIVTKPETTHVCYCLTPTRYLWSGYEDYFRNKYLKFFSKPVVCYLKKIDAHASRKPDKMIAISTEVQNRIKKYYSKDSEIVFPPTNMSHSHFKNSLLRGPAPRSASRSFSKNASFLVVSRLVPYKKVDLVIRVFNKLGHRLVIVGTGSEEGKLKKLAKKNIKFVGSVSEKKLAGYYQDCEALIFPQHEDFGLVAVEALSFGKPVVAYKAGGALDIINDSNGVFFDRQDEASLEKAIKRVFTKKFDNDIIISTSRKFMKDRFKEEFTKAIR